MRERCSHAAKQNIAAGTTMVPAIIALILRATSRCRASIRLLQASPDLSESGISKPTCPWTNAETVDAKGAVSRFPTTVSDDNNFVQTRHILLSKGQPSIRFWSPLDGNPFLNGPATYSKYSGSFGNGPQNYQS